jgi:hypothetical protein
MQEVHVIPVFGEPIADGLERSCVDLRHRFRFVEVIVVEVAHDILRLARSALRTLRTNAEIVNRSYVGNKFESRRTRRPPGAPSAVSVLIAETRSFPIRRCSSLDVCWQGSGDRLFASRRHDTCDRSARSRSLARTTFESAYTNPKETGQG